MELESHPLDTGDRRQLIQERMGLGMCNITKCCTEVCPEHIKITDNGIIPLKERVVDAKYDPVAWLGRKMLGRKVAPVPPPPAGPSPIHHSIPITPITALRLEGPIGSGSQSQVLSTSSGSGSSVPPTVPGATPADGYWGPPEEDAKAEDGGAQ